MRNQYFIKDMVSIVMPFYNNSELVVEMISSIQSNSCTNWELILVDDSSIESEYNRLSAYVMPDTHIHIMRRDRMPKDTCTCRNIGLKQVRGEYTCFFDSDDYITPTCLQKRVNAISKAPQDIDFVIFPSGI